MSKILLIEDEVFVRELYEKILKQSGFTVISAANAKDAFEKLEEKPDLILLDIQLPDSDGISILKKIKLKRDTANITVLMLTNIGQEEIIKEAITNGAQGYMMKSKITPFELVSHVKEFLQNTPSEVKPSKE